MYKRSIGYIALSIGILTTLLSSFDFAIFGKVAEDEANKILKIQNYPLRWSPIIGLLFFLTGLMIIMISNKKPPKK
jgi:hypothetical protein